MTIDVSKLIGEKLQAMEQNGTIEKAIEAAIEKNVTAAFVDAVNSYELRSAIQKQVKEAVNRIAADCGLSAYNGYIAETVRKLVADVYTEDAGKRVTEALQGMLLQHHDGIKLSEIFAAYRKWVNDYTDASDQRERGTFTAALELGYEANWDKARCWFDEDPDKDEEDAEISFRLLGWKKDGPTITNLRIGRCQVSAGDFPGFLTEFEALLVNLYYNKTKIVFDAEAVDDDTHYEDAWED